MVLFCGSFRRPPDDAITAPPRGGPPPLYFNNTRDNLQHHLADVSDDELLVSARNHPDSFGVFYRRHARTILHYFWRRTRDHEASSDLTAETFAAALEGLERFDPSKGNASQWLYGIAANLLRRFWRRLQTSQHARNRLAIITPDPVRSRADELSATDAALDKERLTAALERIPKKQRDAVTLRIYEELTYDRIGQLLSCSPGAARVRVLRGLRRLQEEFDNPPSKGSSDV